MTMISHELTVHFSNKVEAVGDWGPDGCSINIDLTWMSSHRREFIEAFSLEETQECLPMMTLRADTSLEKFLSFHGATFADAVDRWRWLKHHYEHNKTTITIPKYIDVMNLEVFYQELDRGNRPDSLVLEVIEHY